MRFLPVLALGASATLAFAQVPKPPQRAQAPLSSPQEASPLSALQFADYLSLTPEQRTKLQQLREAHRPALEARRTALRQARQALTDALPDSKLTDGQLKALADKEAKARLDEVLETRALVRESSAVLSLPQLEKYQRLCADLPILQEMLSHKKPEGGRSPVPGTPPSPEAPNEDRPEPPAWN